jgi:small subunit ribosomal protein S18
MRDYSRPRGEGFAKRKRVCRFCEDKVKFIDYQNDRLLRRFVNERGKIVPRRISGNCAHHQRRLTTAVKRARHLAIMPFTSEYYR